MTKTTEPTTWHECDGCGNKIAYSVRHATVMIRRGSETLSYRTLCLCCFQGRLRKRRSRARERERLRRRAHETATRHTQIMEWYKGGEKVMAIARRLGMHHSSLYWHLNGKCGCQKWLGHRAMVDGVGLLNKRNGAEKPLVKPVGAPV